MDFDKLPSQGSEGGGTHGTLSGVCCLTAAWSCLLSNQAHEYEQAQQGLALQQFFDSTQGKFKTATG
jgi:hypothetical protein